MSPPPQWSGSAFGLTVDANFPLVGFDRGVGSVGGRAQSRLRQTTPEAIEATWHGVDAERLFEWSHPDGRLGIALHAHPVLGYRVKAPEYGNFHVASDGSRIDCARVPGPKWHLDRALFAQALPIAAALNGFELLHASAVAVDGTAVAFAGHSGTGKSSLAINLVGRGTSLLTDDVVALSVADGVLQAHPGATFASIAAEQIAAFPPDRRKLLGEVIGHSDKTHIRIERRAGTAMPLSALYFLERRKAVRSLSIERLSPLKPRWLLAAAFIPHVTTAARMKAQLDICALTATQVDSFRVRVPPGLSAAELASLVEAHIGNPQPV